MRQAIGTSWILGIVVVFILIFASYLALTISYQKTFKVKNEVLSIIERQEGITDTPGKVSGMSSISMINNYLTVSGYKQQGKCPDGWKGATSLSKSATKSDFEWPKKGKRYYYCVKKLNTGNKAYPGMSYYKVKLFYKFGLPVIGDIITFDVDGETNDIAFPADEDYEFWGG